MGLLSESPSEVNDGSMITKEPTRSANVEIPEFEVGRPKYDDVCDTLFDEMKASGTPLKVSRQP